MGSLKGKIRADHIPLNKYALTFIGLLPTSNITFLTVSGAESEIAKVELPDRTAVSSGQSGTSEMTVTVPAHHDDEVTSMENWFSEGEDPVSPTYKKVGTLTLLSGEGKGKSWSLIGVWNMKRKHPDMAFENEGEMAVYEYVLSIDEIRPIGLPL